MKPLLDILMPIHDNVAWVRLAVQAVQSFTKNAYRLVLIDNASEQDETADWLNSHQQNGESAIHVLWRSVNDSFSESINHGLTWTKANDPAPFVVFLNSDAIVTPGWDVIMTTEAGRPDVGMTGASDGTFRPGQDVGVSFLIFFAVCARREVVDKVGYLDAETCPGWGGGEDLDYAWRIADYQDAHGIKCWKLMSSATQVFHGTSQTYATRRIDAGTKQAMEIANQERLKKKHGIERFNRGLKVRPRICLGRLSRTEMIINSYMDCTIRMLQGSQGRFEWLQADCTRTLVDMGRNMICDWALERNCDYVLFIDDDMTFGPDLAIRLMAHDKDIVSAWAYQRGAPHDPVCYEWAGDEATGGHVPMRNAADTGLRKVDAVGFGAVLIKTSVLKKMKRPWFGFKRFGEDIGFCHAAREAGFGVYCDTDLEIGHLGGRVEVNKHFVHKFREASGDVISGGPK